jgi:HSP20 family protein
MQREFNKDLADWFGAPPKAADSSLAVWTKAGEAIITAPLPGVELDDIQVTVHRDTVTLSVKSADDPLPEGGSVLRKERVREAIERTVQLPFEADKQKVSATYQRGVLVLRLAAVEASQPASIEVTAE